MGALTARQFLEQTGLDETLMPGQVKYRQHVSEKEGNSYTVKYDWKTDHNQIAVEIIPGLTGEYPNKKELSKFAVWLQTKNIVVFELGLKPANEDLEKEADIVKAVKAAADGKHSIYQSLATKVSNTAKIIGEKVNQIPIAVEGAKQVCKVAMAKAFAKSSKSKAKEA